MKDELTKAIAGLEAAQEDFDAMHQRANIARNEETDARNRLNAAQKAFDTAVADVKKRAPWDTSWSTRRGVSEAK